MQLPGIRYGAGTDRTRRRYNDEAEMTRLLPYCFLLTMVPVA